jgi:cell division protein FtsI/penicillin-binding protein 2
MTKASLLQRAVYHALRNARWWLLALPVLAWYGALALRLEFLRSEGANREQTIALRAWADRKCFPLRIQGTGGYFRIVSDPPGPDLRRCRLVPMDMAVRLDGVLVPSQGADLDRPGVDRRIEVDGLILRYVRRPSGPMLALAGWERREDCVRIGKSLSAEVSLDAIGLPPWAARLCRGTATIENLSSREPLFATARPIAPRHRLAWDVQRPLVLKIGDGARAIRLRVEAPLDGVTRVLLDPGDQPLYPIERQAVVGNLQMQFTRVLPRSKADHQLLETLQEALDQNLLALDPPAAAARQPSDTNPDPRWTRIVAAAATREQMQASAVLEDGRVRRLLADSRRQLQMGQPENSHFYVEAESAQKPSLVDVRPRAVSVTANRDLESAGPMQVTTSGPQSPVLEVLDGPLRGARILTEGPVAAGQCHLLEIGAIPPEALAAAVELRMPGAEAPGAPILSGRTILLSDGGAAVLHPEVPPEFSGPTRVYLPIAAGDTLDSIVRRLASASELRGVLKARILAMNPGLDPRRLRPGHRIAVEPWPEAAPAVLSALKRGGLFPHAAFEHRGERTYARIIRGPASLRGEPLQPGAVVPLRSGDRLSIGRTALQFRDARGVLRERRFLNGRLREAHPMGSDSVLLAGFEDRLKSLAVLPAEGRQSLSLDGDLQQIASHVLREHLLYLDSLPGRTYRAAGRVHAGSVTVLNWRTGAILAAASWPAFEPETPGAYQDAARERSASSPLLDRAFFSLRPAGSTFKLLVLAAYLEQLERDGRLPAEGERYGPTFTCGDGVTRGSGAIVLDGRQLRCHRSDRGGHGIVRGVGDALAVSCNVYFVKLALQLGGLRWVESLGVASPQHLAPWGRLAQDHPVFDAASRLGFDFDLRGVTQQDRRVLGGVRMAAQSADLFCPIGVSPSSVPPAGAIPAPLHYHRAFARAATWESFGLAPRPHKPPRIEYKPLRHLAYLAIGQDMTLSTYHLALIAAAIGSDGILPQTWIAPAAARDPGRRIFSSAVARRLREAMAGVATPLGTAPVLRSQALGGRFPFIIFAKTGTAQIAASRRGAPEERRADSLLVSFVDDPRLPPLAAAFRVENGDSTRDDRGQPLPTPAKHLAARFYSAVLDLYGLWPERPQLPPPLQTGPEPGLVLAEPPEAPPPARAPADSGPDPGRHTPAPASSRNELTRQLNQQILRSSRGASH